MKIETIEQGNRVCLSLFQLESHDLWDVDATLALIITPVLRAYRAAMIDPAISSGHPSGFESSAQWLEAISQMIWSFEQATRGYNGKPTYPAGADLHRAYERKLAKGFKLFAEYFQNLLS